MIDSKARWVWIDSQKSDEYCSFQQGFKFDGQKITLNIRAVTNYVAYVNGKRIGFGIFAGYTFEKYFDQIDITPYCNKGENQLTVTVWNEGVNTATHIAECGGLIFSIEEDGHTVAFSEKDFTKGGLHGGYMQNRCRRITYQLGYTSGMISDYSIEYGKCREVNLTYNLKPRPVKKLIEVIAKDVAPYGVTLNNVAPGAIKTPRNQDAYDNEEIRKKVESCIPMGRFGEPEDCVGAVLMLCSEQGSYITGTDIVIDGGMKL